MLRDFPGITVCNLNVLRASKIQSNEKYANLTKIDAFSAQQVMSNQNLLQGEIDTNSLTDTMEQLLDAQDPLVSFLGSCFVALYYTQ